MPIDWSALPAEIWLLVFSHVVGDIKQLAQCCLISKTWDPLAERAMFGQALQFRNTTTLTRFYNHVVRKPFLGRCIKYIHFEPIIMGSLPFHRYFLQLAFTPTIRSVQGTANDESLKIMLDIAKGSTERFKKLAYLPLPPMFDATIHKEMALYFFERP
ncbi:[Pyruvate dehydrogenase (acetyl-transferring)] kinase isozyme 2 [Mucor velutinosus]|uniref:[Pyruvate dehydrogenase (Acetyl-transferring)] kinase isozyme 2 n=1 Tax=Mucor velutinosus TaxID=708070 RepID=A0AAN7D8D9_9FUNG|nr:[Pyruvate dehydrogenase (acetyl-transferring)] kinase isozyme 2 [Mucor velutinosus]